MADTATIRVVMPQMGDSVSEGTILEWHKAAGERVTADETIVEISTDKVDAEVAAPATGTVVRIHGAEGDTISVGELLAEIAADADGSQRAEPETNGSQRAEAETNGSDRAEAETNGRARQAATAANGHPTEVGAPSAAVEAPEIDRPKASPVARRVAEAEHVDLARLAGTGTAGRITKADVLEALHDGSADPASSEAAPGPPSGAQPLRGAAAMLARYMEESRQIPTATSMRTLTMSVARLASQPAQGDGSAGFLHAPVAYAIARAASDIPTMTHHFAEVDGKPMRIDDGGVNLGLAVDVVKKDGSRTLMVPVIADAGRLGFGEFVGGVRPAGREGADEQRWVPTTSSGRTSR